MKKLILVSGIILCTAGVLFAVQQGVKSGKAETVARQMIERDDGKTAYRMLELVTCQYSENGEIRKCVSRPVRKKVENIAKDTGAGMKDKVELGVIIEPLTEKGTVFLQKGYDDGRESDQWIYFPAMKKLKRIVSESTDSPRDGSVFGTEVAYEDVEMVHVTDYTYSYEGEDTVDGKLCDVIIMTTSPGKAARSSYRYIRAWIEKDTHIELKSEKYDRTGRLYKTVYRKKIVQCSGVWMPLTEICVNHRTKRMTMQRILSNVVNIPIDEGLFEQRAIEDGAFREKSMALIRKRAE